MKKWTPLFLIFCAIFLVFDTAIEARGGRGGMRGGGGRAGMRGGGGRGGSSLQRRGPSSMHRSPSISPSTRRTPREQARRPRTRQQPGRAGDRGYRKEVTPARSNLEQFLQQSPGPADRLGTEGGLDGIGQGRLRQDRPQLQDRRKNAGGGIRDRVRNDHPARKDWFDRDFFNRYHLDDRFDFVGGDAWKWTTWSSLNGWYGGYWAAPYYYDYDCEDGSTQCVYSSDQDQPPPEPVDYSQQTQQIAETTQDQADSEWMPLGVFAISRDKEAKETPNAYIQLAVNKQGNIAGTLYNTTYDKAYPLEGVVDMKTQRAAWMMSDSENSPIVETGLFNLTKDEAPVRITFADGSTQDGLLVRLEQPK